MAQTLVVGFGPHDMRPGVTQASAVPGLGTDSPKGFFYSLSPLECWPSPRHASPRDTVTILSSDELDEEARSPLAQSSCSGDRQKGKEG